MHHFCNTKPTLRDITNWYTEIQVGKNQSSQQ